MGTGRRHNVMACSERSRPSRHILRAYRRARAAPVRPLAARRLATRSRPGSRVAPHPTRPRGSPFTRRWGRPTWFETWGAGGAGYRSGSRRPTWSAAPRVAVRAPTHARVRVPAGEAGSSGRPVPAVRSRHVHTPSPQALLATPSCSRPPAHALLVTPLRPGTAPTRYPPIPTSASYVRDAAPTLREVTARAARRSCPGRDVGPDGGAARMHLGFPHALRTSPVPFPLRRRNARAGLPGRRSRAELARHPRPYVDVEPQDVR